MVNARNVNFRISLRWPIHIIIPVDKTKLSCNTPHRRSTTVSLETCPPLFVLYSVRESKSLPIEVYYRHDCHYRYRYYHLNRKN